MTALSKSLVPWLAPLAPLTLAATVLTWHETHTSPAHLDRVAAHPRTEPVLPQRLEIVGRRFSAASGSKIRVCVGTAPNEVWVCARTMAGTLCLGADGMPEKLAVSVDLESLRREDSEAAGQLTWDMLGVQRYASLAFRGMRQIAIQTTVPGVSKVEFRGSMQVGSVTRHVTIPLWVSRMPNNRIRVLGRGRTFGSEYGLRGRRGTMPFCKDEPLVVVWDLIFQPSIG